MDQEEVLKANSSHTSVCLRFTFQSVSVCLCSTWGSDKHRCVVTMVTKTGQWAFMFLLIFSLYYKLNLLPCLCWSIQLRCLGKLNIYSKPFGYRMWRLNRYRFWKGAGRIWAAGLFVHPEMNLQTDSGPHQSHSDLRYCRSSLQGKSQCESGENMNQVDCDHSPPGSIGFTHHWASHSGKSCTSANYTTGHQQTCGTRFVWRTACHGSLSTSRS